MKKLFFIFAACIILLGVGLRTASADDHNNHQNNDYNQHDSFDNHDHSHHGDDHDHHVSPTPPPILDCDSDTDGSTPNGDDECITPTPVLDCDGDTDRSNPNADDVCVTPTPTVTPTATPTVTPTPTATLSNGGGSSNGGSQPGDGRSDGRSDGLCSQPPCISAGSSQSGPAVLGASTFAGTGTFENTLMNFMALVGTILLGAGAKSYAKEKNK